MATTHKLVSLIMCDDCRREDNGKEIIIGAYTGAIITPIIPVMLPTFALRFEIIPNQNEYKKTIAIIKNPLGEEIIRVEGGLAVSRTDFGASFFYRISPLPIMMAGAYTIYLGLDEEPEEVGRLMIIQEQVSQFSPPS
jgi:hypothetical protein